MGELFRSRLGSNLVLIAGSAVVPAAAVHFMMREGAAPINGTQHLYIVAIGALIAGIASVALMARGITTRDGRAVVAGSSFSAMTVLLVFHGLATPGVLLGPNGLVALAGGTALPVGGAILTLAALPAVRRPQHLRHIGVALSVLLVALIIGGTAAMLVPSVVPSLPKAGEPSAWALAVIGAIFFLGVAQRAVRTYTLTRRSTDLLVVVGVVWLGVALYPALLLQPGTWGWWMGHILEFVGIGLVGIPLAIDVRRGAPSRPVIGDLPAGMLVADAETFLGGEVRALLHRLASHDGSTEEHTRRVAAWAVAMGEELGLRGGRLRDLAQAGIVHDIGKLSVPRSILAKPGSLSDEEMDVIRRHPVWGDEILAQLGYSVRIRRWVRGHHERLDGSGYPDALDRSRLDLETRILAVADVYDALVSPRAYRPPWTHDAALELLRDGAGIHYDERCVDTLEGLVRDTHEPRRTKRAALATSRPSAATHATHP